MMRPGLVLRISGAPPVPAHGRDDAVFMMPRECPLSAYARGTKAKVGTKAQRGEGNAGGAGRERGIPDARCFDLHVRGRPGPVFWPAFSLRGVRAPFSAFPARAARSRAWLGRRCFHDAAGMPAVRLREGTKAKVGTKAQRGEGNAGGAGRERGIPDARCFDLHVRGRPGPVFWPAFSLRGVRAPFSAFPARCILPPPPLATMSRT